MRKPTTQAGKSTTGPVASARAGIQSVEVGARLLEALTTAPAAMNLKDLAAAADMPMSKAHRYLVSFARSRLIEQDPVSGRYDLGSLALTMGLTALGRIDVVRLATAALPDLRDSVDETAVLAIWGEHGATIIRFEESAHPVRMNVRVGSVLPLTRSAIGQIFAAYLAEKTTKDAILQEQRQVAAGGPAEFDGPSFDAELADIRRRGLNRNIGVYVPGVSVMAAPILDHDANIVAVVAVLGHQSTFDAAWDGALAQTLSAAAVTVSRRLGHAIEA